MTSPSVPLSQRMRVLADQMGPCATGFDTPLLALADEVAALEQRLIAAEQEAQFYKDRERSICETVWWSL